MLTHLSRCRIPTLGVFFPFSLSALLGCAGGGAMLAGMSDWSTLYGGKGTVETRVENESSETITVRVQDERDQVVGQAPLGPHGSETLTLPVGSVHATVRVMRDGHASYSEPKIFQVSPEHAGAKWSFTAPTIE